MEVPGPLFHLSAGCFGKQDCQICADRQEQDLASMVWLMTLIGSKGGSEFTRLQCVSLWRGEGEGAPCEEISDLLSLDNRQ